MKCTAHYGTSERVKADVRVLLLPEDASKSTEAVARICPELESIVKPLRAKGRFTGKLYETTEIATPAGRFVLVGVGDEQALSAERLRRAAAQASLAVASAATLAVWCPFEQTVKKIPGLSLENVANALVEGVVLADYKYNAFRSKLKQQEQIALSELKIVTAEEGLQGRLKSGIQHALMVTEAVLHARDLVNAPGNILNPETLVNEAVRLGKKFRINTIILDRKQIEANRMGGLIAVNRGSTQQPYVIVMEYNDKKRRLKPWVLVGKGITFDSGGLSLKPSSAMEDMKSDMSGAAAVLGCMQTVAKMKLPHRIIAIIPVTDNMPSGTALCPGDILTMLDGTSVEVRNTDAEGRLILADAIAYAHRYKPAGIIDIATLSGACVVALASHATGMLGNDMKLMQTLRAAGERTFERVWELPLFEEYSKMLESDVADLKNTAGRWGGTSTAAAFLKHFVGDVPWVHLDIAGTAFLEKAEYYLTKGGTGVGVRLLTEFFRTLKSEEH